MIQRLNMENQNLKVLGILVRVKRNQLGYSLRDLAQLANISHTLISNFEQGKLVPHQETIEDLVEVLGITYHTDPSISEEVTRLYNQAFHHIVLYEYEDAKRIIDQIEQQLDVYENSIEAVNVAIIRCLFYAISNMFFEEFDQILAQYEVVLDFLTDSQKQLFYFIKGLNFVNKEYYYDARQCFETALTIGNDELDLLIQEYYVITLSKSNKYVDARIIAEEAIVQFEKQTNYVRAMRLRTRIAYDLYRINLFEEAEAIYHMVLPFAQKFQVQDLMDRCHTRLSLLHFIKQDYEQSKVHLDQVTPGYNRLWYYLQFDLAFAHHDVEAVNRLYHQFVKLDWVQRSEKTTLFFELIPMRIDAGRMDKQKFEQNLIRLVELGHQSDDGEMIEAACTMLSKFYKNERKYKAALNVLQMLLDYNKNGIVPSKYNSERLFKIYTTSK